MSMTAEEIKKGFATDPKATSQTLGDMLRDFGYPNVTDEETELEIRSQLEGNEPSNPGYGLWLQGWLRNGIE